MKRFRYKGDLSKHIKKYHPGHEQVLVPLELQPDELETLAAINQKQSNNPNAVTIAIGTPAASASSSARSTPTVPRTLPSSTDVTPSATPNQTNQAQQLQPTAQQAPSQTLFFPLLPQHPVKPSELEGVQALVVTGESSSPQVQVQQQQQPLQQHQQQQQPLMQVQNSSHILTHSNSTSDDNNDPSLDDQIIDMLAADANDVAGDDLLNPSNVSVVVTEAPAAAAFVKAEPQPQVAAAIAEPTKLDLVVIVVISCYHSKSSSH